MFIWQSLISHLTTLGLKLIACVIVLLVGFRLSKWAVGLLGRGKGFSKLDGGAQSFIKSFAGIALKALVLIIVASILGIPMTSVITVLGTIGVAIGLALQGGLSNIAGGLIILIFKPFTVGSCITAGEFSGTVDEISIFYTKLTTPDNQKVIIPNGIISNQPLMNASEETTRRVDFEFSVSYDADIDRVKQLLLDIGNAHPLTLKDPAPMARLSAHGDSALVFVFRVWCKAEHYWDLYFDIKEQVKKALDAEHIAIPYPQLDVHIHK